MCLYRVHTNHVVEHFDLAEPKVAIMHPAILLAERKDRHVVQVIEGRALLCNEWLALISRIEAELTQLRELLFKLWDK